MKLYKRGKQRIGIYKSDYYTFFFFKGGVIMTVLEGSYLLRLRLTISTYDLLFVIINITLYT